MATKTASAEMHETIDSTNDCDSSLPATGNEKWLSWYVLMNREYEPRISNTYIDGLTYVSAQLLLLA